MKVAESRAPPVVYIDPLVLRLMSVRPYHQPVLLEPIYPVAVQNFVPAPIPPATQSWLQQAQAHYNIPNWLQTAATVTGQIATDVVVPVAKHDVTSVVCDVISIATGVYRLVKAISWADPISDGIFNSAVEFVGNVCNGATATAAFNDYVWGFFQKLKEYEKMLNPEAGWSIKHFLTVLLEVLGIVAVILGLVSMTFQPHVGLGFLAAILSQVSLWGGKMAGLEQDVGELLASVQALRRIGAAHMGHSHYNSKKFARDRLHEYYEKHTHSKDHSKAMVLYHSH
eukprot:c11994_g1_i1.p1 GENE.c11994_g1_i1~~c11994_g1_i1.p1  ORF type:complete len:283 (+),score=52.20 c11994_g1_i1:186-1034(+)